ncbi:MAG: serine/threonine protein kinase [Acidobacteriia bacterium]|nr:serine/threonine protein kinase [Terriglobia bacterium]
MSDSETKRLGDYEILDELGAGGMGRVYRVRNVLTDRVEAMKVLLPNLQGHEEVAARFLREIKVLAALNHPNIAALRTALTIENQLVMVMEYVEGESLSSRLNIGAIPVGEALKYLDQVLDALSYAHRHHVIHRDIKPANMMLTRQGVVKLMDFGIAHTEGEAKKLTATGSTLGSISYMSPEQVKGEATDERSDLYSLGISLYEMVTGKRPFDEGSSFSIMAAHVNQAPRPPVELHPGLPATVNDLILTSIAKLPSERFQTADAFRNAVRQARASVPADDRTILQGSASNTSADAPTVSRLGAAANDRTVVQGSTNDTVDASMAPTASHAAIPSMPAPLPPAYRQAYAAAPTPAPPRAASPQSAAAPAQAPPAAASHRGLYMALGGLLVVVALIGAGLYMPGHKKASASDAVEAPKVMQQTAAPTPAPAATPVAAPEPTPDAKALAHAKAQRLAQEKAAADAAAAAERKAQLDQVEHQIDQLTGRAGAVNASLNTMQRQQAAAGYGLRGDMASAQTRLNVNLQKAQSAIQAEDLDRAKRYAAQSEADLEVLEKFLGR